jgi:2-keto-3-deoxy-L-rhamnonate aldolase RhmA
MVRSAGCDRVVGVLPLGVLTVVAAAAGEGALICVATAYDLLILDREHTTHWADSLDAELGSK